MKRTLLSDRGSISVEAALIVPIVIITVMILLYIVLIIFQICIMRVTANGIAERAAGICNSKGSFFDGSTSKSDISALGLYRRWGMNSASLYEEISSYALQELQANSILKGKSQDIEIKQKNNILNQSLEVTLSADYYNPLGGLAGAWGMGKEVRITVKAQAAVEDPAEFVRNADFIIDTASQVPIISEFESKWKEIIDKIIQYVDKFMKERKAAYEQ